MGSVSASTLVKVAVGYVGRVTYVIGAEHGTQIDLPMTEADCSGFTRVVVAQVAGHDLLGQSDSETQWAQSLGGRVPANGPLLPGDVIARRGDGTFSPPGHIAFCVSYDPGSQEITCVSALGTGLGVRIDVVSRLGDQYIGAFRVANAIPDPAPPPPPPPAPPVPKEQDMIIAICPTIAGDWLCIGSRRCHVSPAELALIEALYSPPKKTVTAAQLTALTVTAWGQI